jgi:hypothetical protein
MKTGIYWYSGPYFRDGEPISAAREKWSVVQVHEFGMSFMGSDWDLMAADVALMEEQGQWIPIDPPP